MKTIGMAFKKEDFDLGDLSYFLLNNRTCFKITFFETSLEGSILLEFEEYEKGSSKTFLRYLESKDVDYDYYG